MTLAVPGDGGLLEPSCRGSSEAEASSKPAARRHHRVPGLTIAAMASMGAGIIHAAAAGVHAEHPQLARLFILCAVAQVGVGLLALAPPASAGSHSRSSPSTPSPSASGWRHASPESRGSRASKFARRPVRRQPRAPCWPRPPSVVLSAAAMVGERQSAAARLSFPALAVAALTIPAMLSGGTHVHSHAASQPPAVPAVVDESQPHSHTADGTVDRRRCTALTPRPIPLRPGGRRIAAAQPCRRRQRRLPLQPTGRGRGTQRSRSTCRASPVSRPSRRRGRRN